MGGIGEALTILDGLIALISRASEAGANISAVVGKAQSEGRDLTPEEVAACRAAGEAADAEWQGLAPK